MGALMYLLSLLAIIHHGQSASLKLCQNDKDCGENKFCYAKTGLCSPCIQCSAYLRLQRDSFSCAKEPWQCGDCLEGYEVEELLDGQLRGLCVPTTKVAAATSDPQPLLKVAESQNFVLVGALVSFVVFISIIVTVYMKRRTCPVKVCVRTRVEHPCDDSSSTPSIHASSPSVQHAPSAPPPPYEVFSEDGDEETYRGYVCEREEQKCQMASKFLDPNYVRTHNNSNLANNNPPPQEDVTDGPPDPDEAFLIDENTVPSLWSPGPEYEEPAPSETTSSSSSSSSPLITSFAGILLNNTGLGGGQSPPEQPTNHTASGSQTSNNAQNQHNFNVTNITVINTAAGPTGVFNITNI